MMVQIMIIFKHNKFIIDWLHNSIRQKKHLSTVQIPLFLKEGGLTLPKFQEREDGKIDEG